MPSASAKLEKQTSTDVPDPVKQVLTVVEKKVRNLEKRKGKLDAYKHDHQSGKELNEDQRNAIKKYDLVVELLDFAKELQKSFTGIVQENVKLQKKAAKREQVEKQQQETQRIKELLLLQDILVNMGTQEIRNDFLHGTNGALKLDEENLSHLDEFYKLMSPDRSSEENSNFEEQLSAAAEHLGCLLDGKNKEVLNTTYKNIKELMMKINDCGYFSPSVGATGADESGEECGKIAEEDCEDVPTGVTEVVRSDHRTEEEQVDPTGLSRASQASIDTPYYSTAQHGGQTRPLQDILPVQGTLDFLQDSQIDLQSLRIDPAVVVARPIIPPTSIGYPVSYHGSSNHPSQDIQTSQPEMGLVGRSNVTSAVPAQQQQMQVPEGSSNSPMSLQQQPINAGQDYDAVCPIPTQTYTNQSFAAVHPIVPVTVPGNYVPDAMGHPSLQQMVPVGIVPPHVTRTLLPPQTSDAHAMPIASQASGVVPTNVNLNNQSDGKEFDSEFQMQQEPADTGSGSNRFGTSSEFQQVDDTQDYSSNQQQNFTQNRGYATARGNRGARTRGPDNGYTRGNSTAPSSRGGYGNGSGRGGYQNTGNYYQGSYAGRDNFNNNATNYSNAYKQRGSARSGGAPVPKTVNPGSRGGSNGRGGYRSQ